MNASIMQRAGSSAVLILIGWQVGASIGVAASQPRNAILGISVGGLVGFLLAPIIVTLPYEALRRVVSSTPPGDLIFGIAGMVLGLLAAALLAYPLSLLPWQLGHVMPAIAAAICAYLGVTFLMMRHRELTQWLQIRTDKEVEEGKFLVDTNAIIDGRIADICEAGFLLGQLVIPRFVLNELQHIADSSDSQRRNRGRRGLETLSRLQRGDDSRITVSDADVREISDVDGKLVKLARDMSCPVITNDFNLNRVAELQGVRVLNINQLANALKPVVLPGEEMEVHIIQDGKEVNQGVGYLDDGTMIVVENGRRFMHNHVEIVVTRVLQTVAGRMIFAQLKNSGHG
jgi:uncharacterized protein YacL